MKTVNFDWHLLKINPDYTDEPPADHTSLLSSFPILSGKNNLALLQINMNKRQRHVIVNR